MRLPGCMRTRPHCVCPSQSESERRPRYLRQGLAQGGLGRGEGHRDFMARPTWTTHHFFSGSPLWASVSPFVELGQADYHSAQSFEEALCELAPCLLAWFWQYFGSTGTSIVMALGVMTSDLQL